MWNQIKWFEKNGWNISGKGRKIRLARDDGLFHSEIVVSEGGITSCLKYGDRTMNSVIPYEVLYRLMNICNALGAGEDIEI